MFQPSSGTLNLLVKQAKDLPAVDSNGLANASVKCYLLPDRSSTGKRGTGVIRSSQHPVWEERFVYENVSPRELLEERVVEVTVWDSPTDSHSNHFIGGLRVGGSPGRSAQHEKWMDSAGVEVSHWEQMLSRPGEWVEEWHTLRPSMVPKEVDLSVSPPPFTIPVEETLNGAHLTAVSEPLPVSDSKLELADKSPANQFPSSEAESPLAADIDPSPPNSPHITVSGDISEAHSTFTAESEENGPHSNSQRLHEEEPKFKVQV